ncbi:protein kinase [Frankia sp. CNm7]|nr:protein kinase [Frankia nepalensis]MBL7523634.1 protein kinase [Frankia nepalensis]
MVGQYRLVGVLGEGGFGRVFLGRSPEDRQVAVKVAKTERAADPEFRRMFHREVRLARLVPQFCTAVVLDSGEEGGRPYLVTEFVDGPTLRDHIRDHGPLTSARLTRVAVAIANALVAIHGVGMVHRDLKPGNVLLSPDGPLVIDFGIAAALGGTARFADQVTPGFLAPEQVEWNQPVGPPADVFAWGAVVAYAATGQHPYGTGGPEAFLFRVVHEEPDLTGVPDPLRAIVADAMRRDPAARPTAAALHDRLIEATTAPAVTGRSGDPATLDAVVRPGPVNSGGPPAKGRGRRWAVLALVAAVIGVAVLVPLAGWWPAGDRTLATEERPSAAHQLVVAARRAEDPELAFRLALAAYRTDPSREAALSLLAAADRSDLTAATLTSRTGAIDTFGFSPDGQLLTADKDSTELWDTSVRGAADTSLATFAAGTYSWTFSPDGSRLVTTGPTGALRLWDTSRRAAVTNSLATFDETNFGGFSPDGALLATDGDRFPGERAVHLWDISVGPVATDRPLATVADSRFGGFSPDGSMFATIKDDTVELWDTPARDADASLRLRASLVGVPDLVGGVVFSPDSSLIVAHINGEDTVWVWSTRVSAGVTTSPLTSFTSGLPIFYDAVFSPDSSLVAVISGPGPQSLDRAVRLWDLPTRGRTAGPHANLIGHAEGVGGVVFSPDGTLIATAGEDDVVMLWDPATRDTNDSPLATFTGHPGGFTDLAFSSDGALLATAGADGAIRLWDTSAQGTQSVPLVALPGRASEDAAVLPTSDGLLTATAADNGAVVLWDLDPARLAERSCGDPIRWLDEREWREAVRDLPYQPPCGSS